MKKPILWFVAGALVTTFVMICYASNREMPPSSDASARVTHDKGGDLRTKARMRPSAARAASDVARKQKDISRGIASFYGVNTNGTRTASGIPLDDAASTAAHRTLPFGTFVRVTNLSNGLMEIVKITDRGPYTKGRIIDVSHNAAVKLDMIQAGIISVEVEILSDATAAKQPSLVAE